MGRPDWGTPWCYRFSRHILVSMVGARSLQESSPARGSPLRGAAGRAGARGSEDTKVKGRASCIAIPPSRGPWGTLCAPARQPGFCRFQPGDLGLRDLFEPTSLFGEMERPRLSMLGLGAPEGERLRPNRAEGMPGASQPRAGTSFSQATLRRAQARAGSKMRTKPARI